MTQDTGPEWPVDALDPPPPPTHLVRRSDTASPSRPPYAMTRPVTWPPPQARQPRRRPRLFIPALWGGVLAALVVTGVCALAISWQAGVFSA